MFFSNNTAYKIGRNWPLIYESFGVWTNDKFIDLRETQILSRRRRNLQMYRLIAPVVFMTKGAENYTDLDDY